jgi:spermidine/putrescine-binding protein
MTMLTRRTITKLMLAGAATSVVSRNAQAAGKVVVYTSNDQTLNRFVFEAFTKETGVEVEVVEAGSGVVFRRIASVNARSATSFGA